MGPTALLPLRSKACWGFFHPKNTRTRVPEASTLTSKPPKQLLLGVLSWNLLSPWKRSNSKGEKKEWHENKIICIVFTCSALSWAPAAMCIEWVSDIITNWRSIRAIKRTIMKPITAAVFIMRKVRHRNSH